MAKHIHTPLCCTPKGLDPSTRLIAAENAIAINPLNRAPVERLIKLIPGLSFPRPYISVLTSKRWRTNGVDLSVSFLDNPPQELRDRILGHMNAWNKTAKINFRLTTEEGDVRIARQGGPDGGYWSYLGTDIMLIEAGQPTMNLEAFTMDTPDDEFYRVVRHETGHTLGFAHEHMRGELIAKIDREKAISYYMATQGWSREEVIAQVLTPLEESSLFGTLHADPRSIMCYQIAAALTVDGIPILGGTDIDQSDYDFAAICYPR